MALLPLLVILVAGGCASPVPGQAGASGRRITVTITFQDPPNPGAYWYYFVINRSGSAGVQNSTCGPIAIYGPNMTIGGYGNGYATGSPGCTPNGSPAYFGLTNYVLYSNNQGTAVSGGTLGLYAYSPTQNPNAIPGTTAPSLPQAPLSYTLPDPTSSNPTLQFTIGVSQLVDDGSTGQQLQQEAAAIQFLQVNIIATDVVPTNQDYSGQKDVDAMGNTLTSIGQSSWLEIDLSQNRTYTSTDSTSSLQEPMGDVAGYPGYCGGCSPSIDITYWSIQVSNYGG
jgi:hypothetical protein